MIIAITGATGMIGSTIAKQLLDMGHTIIAIIRPHSRNIKNLPISDKIEIIECDTSDYESLFSKRKCDMFFHMAWDSTFGEKRDDVDIQINNIKNTMTAIKLAHSWGSKAFVGAGSQAEYGPTSVALKGDTPVNPESGYGIAKYTAYKLACMLCKQLDIRFCWGRIISAYGDNDASHTFISYLINSFLDGIEPKVTKCEQIWDYIYSEDVASAFISIGIKGKDGKAYCIGTGKPKKMKEYVEIIKNEIAPELNVHYGSIPYYPHQPMYLCADISDLIEDVGFEPKYSFEEGIRLTISSIIKRRNQQS